MRIVYITAGSGRMDCDACLRDANLARALKAQGHEVLFVPTYTPLLFDSEKMAVGNIFYGGINVFLQQKYALLRRTPRAFDRVLDARWLLRAAARLGDMTNPADLAELTISILEGREGKQRKELERLLDWLATQPRPDLVVLPNSLFAGLAEPVRERLGVPVLCLLSGEDMFIDEFPEPHRTRALEVLRHRAGQLDGFLAASRYYRDFMAEYLQVDSEKIHHAALGIDCSDYAECGDRAAQSKVFTIGHRSAVCPAFGLHVLAEAFRILKQNPATANCRVLASGYLSGAQKPYLDGVLDAIREWGLDAHFEFVGGLEPAERPGFMSRLDALCVPAIYPEPAGTYVPEALSAGVPVIVTRTGCLPEWIEATQGGLLVEPDDPEALAEAIASLMRDPERARALGQAGRRAVLEGFTVEKMAADTVRVFEKYLRGPFLDPT